MEVFDVVFIANEDAVEVAEPSEEPADSTTTLGQYYGAIEYMFWVHIEINFTGRNILANCKSILFQKAGKPIPYVKPRNAIPIADAFIYYR